MIYDILEIKNKIETPQNVSTVKAIVVNCLIANVSPDLQLRH